MRVFGPAEARMICSTAIIAAGLASGCSMVDDEGMVGGEAAATWDLAPEQTLDANTTTFTAMVTRLSCNSGVTGDPNDPAIEITEDQIVITFTVSPGEPSSADCQGNDQVSQEVELPEVLGDRELVDGACASSEVSSTEPCQPSGVRYAP